MSKTRHCACGSEAIYHYPDECEPCHYERVHAERTDFHSRLDVMQLDACDTLDELKDWIKEHLLK